MISDTELPSPQGSGSDIDERGPSCDRKSGQGEALDRREGRNGRPAEVEESPTLSANHMRVWQCCRLPEIAEIMQDSLALEPLCLPRLAVRRSFLCRHHEAAFARNMRKIPVCIGMSFIRKDTPESGPDPSEGPQRPSSVSHKTRRTLSLFRDLMPKNVKCEAHEYLGSSTFQHQTPMRNRIRPEHPLRAPQRTDPPRPSSSSHPPPDFCRRLVFVPVMFFSESHAMKGDPREKHHLRPARDAKADRLCGRAGLAQPDASAVGGSARSAHKPG